MLGILESLGSHNRECGLGPEGGEGLTPPAFRGFIQENNRALWLQLGGWVQVGEEKQRNECGLL